MSAISREKVIELLQHQLEWWDTHDTKTPGTFDDGYHEALADILMDIQYLELSDD